MSSSATTPATSENAAPGVRARATSRLRSCASPQSTRRRRGSPSRVARLGIWPGGLGHPRETGRRRDGPCADARSVRWRAWSRCSTGARDDRRPSTSTWWGLVILPGSGAAALLRFGRNLLGFVGVVFGVSAGALVAVRLDHAVLRAALPPVAGVESVERYGLALALLVGLTYALGAIVSLLRAGENRYRPERSPAEKPSHGPFGRRAF